MSETTRERVPIEPGFFTVPVDPEAPPRLLGSRCRACGEHFFPRRAVCARCLAPRTEDVELGPDGTLYTWTWVYYPLFNSQRAEEGGYGVGQVDLPEGPRVQCVLSGERDAFRIGMPMRLELEVLRENEQGQQVVIYRFAPAEPASAPAEPA